MQSRPCNLLQETALLEGANPAKNFASSYLHLPFSVLLAVTRSAAQHVLHRNSTTLALARQITRGAAASGEALRAVGRPFQLTIIAHLHLHIYIANHDEL